MGAKFIKQSTVT